MQHGGREENEGMRGGKYLSGKRGREGKGRGKNMRKKRVWKGMVMEVE